MPQVSVALPIYNGIEHLSLAIESVLAQSFKDFELIILDDGSTQNISELVGSFCDERIRFISRENKGLGYTLNEIIGLSRGRYIARMDGDDCSYPERLKLQVEFLNSHAECSMVGGQIDFIVGNIAVEAFHMPIDHAVIREKLLQGRFPICHPALMFRRQAALDIGGYRFNGAGEDLDFFLRMSEAGKIYNIQDKILGYRIQLSSLSMRKRDELNLMYAYSLHCARRRQDGSLELKVDEFREQIWHQRSFFEKLKLGCHGRSELYYRAAIVFRAEDKIIKFAVYFFLAAILRPQTTIDRVISIFMRLVRK